MSGIYHQDDIPEDLRPYFVRAEIGLEDTPEAFVARLVEVFREVRRVLRDGAGGDDLLKALQARRRFAAPAALITSDPRWALDRQSPLRIAAASAVQMFRYRIGSR